MQPREAVNILLDEGCSADRRYFQVMLLDYVLRGLAEVDLRLRLNRVNENH